MTTVSAAVVVVVLMAVLLVFVVSAIQAGYSKHLNVCSVKVPPKANMCDHMKTHLFEMKHVFPLCLKGFFLLTKFTGLC